MTPGIVDSTQPGARFPIALSQRDGASGRSNVTELPYFDELIVICHLPVTGFLMVPAVRLRTSKYEEPYHSSKAGWVYEQADWQSPGQPKRRPLLPSGKPTPVHDHTQMDVVEDHLGDVVDEVIVLMAWKVAVPRTRPDGTSFITRPNVVCGKRLVTHAGAVPQLRRPERLRPHDPKSAPARQETGNTTRTRQETRNPTR